MAVDANKVRELAARGEGSTLDFKRADYSWANARAANAELAKDLSAIGNVLGPTAAPGYLLIGVANDGTICGIPPTSHQDDASLHQKVRDLLNRTPRFVYTPVDVDGVSVGVYEIAPGGRTFFPVRDQGSLRKHIAVYRNGTATEIASPQMVLDWDREDDPSRHAIAAAELLRIAADAAVHAAIDKQALARNGDGPVLTLRITNTGRSGLFIDAVRSRLEWREDFFKALVGGGGARELPQGYEPPSGPIAFLDPGRVPPGATAAVSFSFTRAQALQHFADAGLAVAGYNGTFAKHHFEFDCRSELGGSKTLTASVSV
jgi:hypothetical protein